jgi:hypothetical protein
MKDPKRLICISMPAGWWMSCAWSLGRRPERSDRQGRDPKIQKMADTIELGEAAFARHLGALIFRELDEQVWAERFEKDSADLFDRLSEEEGK